LFLFFQQLTDKEQRKETKHPKNHHFFGLMKRFSTTKIEFISTIEQK